MKFLFASDSFKGTLSSNQTIELLTKAAQEVFGSCETSGVPVADGGEGTTDAVVKARSGEIITVPVHGPLMEMEQGFLQYLMELLRQRGDPRDGGGIRTSDGAGREAESAEHHDLRHR